jgi:hypothetical protein
MPCITRSQSVRASIELEPSTLVSHGTDNEDELSFISLDYLDTHDVRMGMEELMTDPPTKDCMVCYEDTAGENVNLKCGHTYCIQCFIQHMRVGNNCAGCRAHICEPPKKIGGIRTLSHNEISDVIENTLSNGPDFITTIHDDLLRQTNKFIEENYEDTTEIQRCQLSVMMKRAITSTDLTFGFWIAGTTMAQGIIDAVNNE